MSKSNPNFRNLDYIPTWKIKDILAHPYCSGVDGQDYEPVKEELQDILWKREQETANERVKDYQRRLREHEKFMLNERRNIRNDKKLHSQKGEN